MITPTPFMGCSIQGVTPLLDCTTPHWKSQMWIVKDTSVSQHWYPPLTLLDPASPLLWGQKQLRSAVDQSVVEPLWHTWHLLNPPHHLGWFLWPGTLIPDCDTKRECQNLSIQQVLDMCKPKRYIAQVSSKWKNTCQKSVISNPVSGNPKWDPLSSPGLLWAASSFSLDLGLLSGSSAGEVGTRPGWELHPQDSKTPHHVMPVHCEYLLWTQRGKFWV